MYQITTEVSLVEPNVISEQPKAGWVSRISNCSQTEQNACMLTLGTVLGCSWGGVVCGCSSASAFASNVTTNAKVIGATIGGATVGGAIGVTLTYVAVRLMELRWNSE